MSDLSSAGDANPASSDPTQNGQPDTTPQPVAQPDPTQEGQQPTAEGATPEQGEEKTKRNSAQERISELVSQRNAATARAEAAEAKLASLVKRAPTPPPPTAPQSEVDAFNVREAISAERVEDQRQEAIEAHAAAQQATFTTFQAKCEAVADRIPGLLDKFLGLPEVSQEMANFVADSDKGAEVANILASNPAEASRIARLPKFRQGIELSKIETSITVAPRRTTQAPPPMPAGPGNAPGSQSKDPGKMSMAEYEAWRKAGGGA